MKLLASAIKVFFLGFVGHAVFWHDPDRITLLALFGTYLLVVGSISGLILVAAEHNRDDAYLDRAVWLGQVCWVLPALTKTGWSEAEMLSCALVIVGAIYLQFQISGNFALLRSME